MSETPDTLRALAEAANEQRSNVGWYAAVDIDITGTFEACELMAACSPKAILALLDERDTLRAEVARLSGRWVEIVALKVEVARLTTERSDAQRMKAHLTGCDECNAGDYCAEGQSYGGDVTRAYLYRITAGNGCRV